MRSLAASALFSCVFVAGGCASSSIAAREAPAADTSAAGDGEFLASGKVAAMGGVLFQAKAAEKRQDGFGLDRQSMDTEGLPVTDEQITRVLDWHALLPSQARVALMEARAVREWCTCGSWGMPDVRVEGTQWSVRPSVSEEVDAMRGELAKSGRVLSVATVPAMFLPLHADLARCRYAAARTSADVVLLYAKATRIVKFHNKLANFYPLILGLALPGEETAIVTRVEGALVDVRTGRVFAVSQATARRSDLSTVFTSSDEARELLVDATEREAVLALAKGIKDELDLVAATPPRVARPGATHE
jgi:hypothetical protein